MKYGSERMLLETRRHGVHGMYFIGLFLFALYLLGTVGYKLMQKMAESIFELLVEHGAL